MILHIELSLSPEKEVERAAWLKAHALTQRAWQTATAARCGYANFSPAEIIQAHTTTRIAGIAAGQESVRTAQARSCRRNTPTKPCPWNWRSRPGPSCRTAGKEQDRKPS